MHPQTKQSRSQLTQNWVKLYGLLAGRLYPQKLSRSPINPILASHTPRRPEKERRCTMYGSMRRWAEAVYGVLYTTALNK